MKKQKTNYFKIGALIMMMVEIGIAIFTKRDLLESIKIWRLYVACIMCIPVNIMFICTKQTRKGR